MAKKANAWPGRGAIVKLRMGDPRLQKQLILLPAVLAAASLAVLLGTGGVAVDAAPAGAATGLHLTQEACAPDVNVNDKTAMFTAE